MLGGRWPTLREQIVELERELATRERVYPTWVRNGTLTREAARHRLDTLAGAIRTLKHLSEEQFARREGR